MRIRTAALRGPASQCFPHSMAVRSEDSGCSDAASLVTEIGGETTGTLYENDGSKCN